MVVCGRLCASDASWGTCKPEKPYSRVVDLLIAEMTHRGNANMELLPLIRPTRRNGARRRAGLTSQWCTGTHDDCGAGEAFSLYHNRSDQPMIGVLKAMRVFIVWV